jgi:NAD(P)-dependent dehydrogenase (short-subunit alcohol dehydrogenase family)
MGRGRIAYYNKAIPIGRVCEPAEVAALLVYLAVDAPDALNGAIYDVDGGLIRR